MRESVKKCPICGGKTKVIDSRIQEMGLARRRCCKACGYRYTTIEVLKTEIEPIHKITKIIKQTER